jgi:hypothetical protein
MTNTKSPITDGHNVISRDIDAVVQRRFLT